MTPFLLFIFSTFLLESYCDQPQNIFYNSPQRPSNDAIDAIASKRAMDEYCHRKFNDFVSSIHNFSDCIMQNSLSYGACAACGDHFQYYNDMKVALETDVRQDQNNRTCAESMHDTKRSLIDVEEKSPLSLWGNGSCDHCYRFNETSKKKELHPDYSHFQHLVGEYQGCVELHRGKTLGNLTRLCGNCSKEYQKLVAFYHASVNDKSSFLLCLDVKQQINASVHEWSYVFKCGRLTKTDRFATYALSAFVILLPIAFYVAVYLQSDDKKIEYEFVCRSSFQSADDGDVGHSLEVSPVAGGAVRADASLSLPYYADDHEDATHHGLGFESDRAWGGRRFNSTAPSATTGSVASGSPRFRVPSPMSSTNNLLM